MIASLRTNAAFSGLLFLCASVLANDSLIDSPEIAANESNLEARVRQLESELEILSQGSSPSSVESNSGSCCCAGPGFFGSAAWINWKVRKREPFQNTQLFPSVTNPDVWDPLEFSSANGIRTLLGYEFADGCQFTFTYAGIRPHGQQLILFGQPGGELYRSFEYINLKYDVIDLQFCLPWSIREGWDVSLFGGVRWAHLDQGRSVNFEAFDAGQLVDTAQDRLRANTNAAGIKTGGTVTRHCSYGFSVFGSAAGAVLIQESTRTFASRSTFDGDLFDRDTSIDGLPVFETAAGISWNNGWLSVKAGYELATWFNMTEVTVVPFAGIPNRTQSLTFDGVFLDLTILF